MKIEIAYNTNGQLWTLEKIAAEHGYTKTEECYWVQIFENENGDHIVTTRDDGKPDTDPASRLLAILEPTEEPQPTSKLRTRKHYQNNRTGEDTASASLAMKWHRAGDMVQISTFYNEPHRTGLANVVHVPGQEQPARQDENREHCKHIALTLDAYQDGEVYRCPDCGEEVRLPDDVGEKYRCPHCETVSDTDDFEQLSLWDYFGEGSVLDMDYIVSSRREYKSCRIMVAFGGPTIYIDTDSGNVELYWWNERARYALRRDTRDAVDEWAEEYWNL